MKAMITRGSLLLIVAAFSAFVHRVPAQEKMGKTEMMQGKSLYQRLGGYDAIAAVTDDFIGRLVANKALMRFFGGASIDTQKRFRQHLVDQLCAATGGPCYYVGRDMKTSHAGLGITEAEWNGAVADLVAALDKFKVPAKEKDELLTIVSSTKKDIVEKP